jgi:hypothetical protein
MPAIRAVIVLSAITQAACGAAPLSPSSSPSAPPPAPALALACDDRLGAIGRPGEPPPSTGDPRGAIASCAPEIAIGAAPSIDGRSTGVRSLRIAYWTTRSDGSPALATARVLLPDAPLRTPSPIAVIAHGTVGIADRCAPSLAPATTDALALPWARAGWPTIAPDYAGLGTEGVQGYGDAVDTARSTLDAARALLALLPESMRSGTIVLAGHSQGGGAVLSAQAIARDYAPGLGIALVVPVAPGWATSARTDTFHDAELRFRGGNELRAVVSAMFLYAWHARRYGDASAGDGFDPAHREALVAAIERGCVASMIGSIPTAAPTLGAMIDPTLRAGLVACERGEPGCAGRAQELHAWMGANLLHGDPEGAPILMIQGDADLATTPARTRCIADRLRADRVETEICVLPGDHLSVLGDAWHHAIDAAGRTVSGAPRQACPRADLPACDDPPRPAPTAPGAG